MYLWFFISNIISKCFSGVLLNSYIPAMKELVVNNIDDLINNPGILVSGESALENLLGKLGN